MSKKSKIQSVNFVENDGEFAAPNPAYVDAPNDAVFYDLTKGTVTPLDVEGCTTVAEVKDKNDIEGEVVAPAEANVAISNRRFEDGQLWSFLNSKSIDSPTMKTIVDADLNVIGFVVSESVAKFICLSVTEAADRVIADMHAQAQSGLVNVQGNQIKS